MTTIRSLCSGYGGVTDCPIPRNAQLKALGNGVVPQQAAAALRILLPFADGLPMAPVEPIVLPRAVSL